MIISGLATCKFYDMIIGHKIPLDALTVLVTHLYQLMVIVSLTIGHSLTCSVSKYNCVLSSRIGAMLEGSWTISKW